MKSPVRAAAAAAAITGDGRTGHGWAARASESGIQSPTGLLVHLGQERPVPIHRDPDR